MEEWKDIKGYEGIYQISSHGNVKSKERVVVYKNGIKARYRERARKVVAQEYRCIILSQHCKIKKFKVARLVALHFLEKEEGKTIVNHIDGNKMNDNLSNLEWSTYSENNLHAFDLGLSKRVHRVPGIFFATDRNKWAAWLYRNNKNIFVGRFNTEQEAIDARQRRLDDETRH